MSKKFQAWPIKNKEKYKTTMGDMWTQYTEMQKAVVDNNRKQYKEFCDYMMKMQEATLPLFERESTKAFLDGMKEFQKMANEHFMKQADSTVDFFFKSQEHLSGLVSAAIEKKEKAAEEKEEEKKEPEKKTRGRAAK